MFKKESVMSSIKEAHALVSKIMDNLNPALLWTMRAYYGQTIKQYIGEAHENTW